MYIDFIALNYENTAGVTSPRAIADVRSEVLEAAVVAGYDTRYGANPGLFDLMLVP